PSGRRRPGHPRRHTAQPDDRARRRGTAARRTAQSRPGRGMSRSGRDPGERLRTARKRTASSARWLSRQINDPYVRQAKADGYRSRAAYRLIGLDERFGLLRGVRRAVDLGIAPGGWSQVVRQQCPKAAVVGIDLLPMEPIEGVTI